MKASIIFGLGILMILSMSGCKTTESKIDAVDGVQEVELVLEREKLEDDNFCLFFDEHPEKCTFYAKHSNVSIHDLVEFAITTCWAKRLSKVLDPTNSNGLTANDVKLLDFCIDLHFVFFDILTSTMLNELVNEDNRMCEDYYKNKSPFRNLYSDNLNSKKRRLDYDMDKLFEELSYKFMKSDKSPLRRNISKWGDLFNNERANSSNWKEIYEGVFNGKTDPEIEAIKSERDDVLRGWLVKNDANEMSSAGSIDMRSLATYEIGEAWETMEILTKRYLKSLNIIYKTMKEYYLNINNKNLTSVYFIQTLLDKKGANVLAYNRYFRGVLYDMPLAFYARRAFAGAYENWHWHGDNEEEMYKAAKYMIVGIRGVKMISKARSLYAIGSYNEVVDFIKNALSDAEYSKLVTDSKMYTVEISDDIASDNKINER